VTTAARNLLELTGAELEVSVREENADILGMGPQAMASQIEELRAALSRSRGADGRGLPEGLREPYGGAGAAALAREPAAAAAAREELRAQEELDAKLHKRAHAVQGTGLRI